MSATKATIKGNRTPLGCSYAQTSGFYQKEYNELMLKYVPKNGAAKTKEGELLRIATILYLEFTKHQNKNAFGDILQANTSIQKTNIPFYKKCINFIDTNVPEAMKCTFEIENIIYMKPRYTAEYLNDPKTLQHYNHLIDIVVEHILNDSNEN